MKYRRIIDIDLYQSATFLPVYCIAFFIFTCIKDQRIVDIDVSVHNAGPSLLYAGKLNVPGVGASCAPLVDWASIR